MRYLLEISYLGKNYAGWQKQPNAHSIQEAIENALSILLRRPTTILGSSRTDAGVHASQQFASFDTSEAIDTEQLSYRANQLLPVDIAISSISEVGPAFHARFDATARAYQYHIARQKNPFNSQTAYLYTIPLNIDAMNKAAKILLQHADYQCFSKTHTDVYTYLCHIEYAYWQEAGNTLVFYIKANRFLRGMVRAIVGTLLDVGLGKLSIEAFEAIILSKNRSKAGRSAPAHGLVLTQVCYS
jgi:tRNA pseudouridine38-40 synthase